MKDGNGSVAWQMNRRASVANKFVEKTERRLRDVLCEDFITETSVNNPLNVQKALAMDTAWKWDIPSAKCQACLHRYCVCEDLDE